LGSKSFPQKSFFGVNQLDFAVPDIVRSHGRCGVSKLRLSGIYSLGVFFIRGSFRTQIKKVTGSGL